MSRMLSYTKIENRLSQDYRQRVNTAESAEDVRKAFAWLLRDLLGGILETEVGLEEGDVRLAPETPDGFELGPAIMENPDFSGLWEGSDLGAILRRQAALAVNRLKHLSKHPERTEAKLYPRPDRR
ncbi:hypothetical protein [Desulfovibrio aminophilus]|uniref:hypothetical protein n=1 Tax=Desulfovibrio aminophilus TaxID=81425 RepID=UPI003390ACF2